MVMYISNFYREFVNVQIKHLTTVWVIVPLLLISACNKEEVTLDQIAGLRTEYANKIFEKTIQKPGPPQYNIGVQGGTYYTFIQSDPKSFNTLVARDEATAAVTEYLLPALFDYDAYTRKFKPHTASFEISYDTKKELTKVVVTLRDDLYWSSANGDKVPITIDDLIYWYDEVEGDPGTQNPGYPGQFVTNSKGESVRTTVVKNSTYSATFTIPAIVADPELMINTRFGPKYIYKPAKQAGGVEGLLDVLSIDMNPKDVPSASLYVLSEYKQGQYIIFERNKNHWRLDNRENILPYIEKVHIQIIKNQDAALLEFKQGNLSKYSARPEDLDSLLEEHTNYDVYNLGPSLGSAFITFNQNPNALEPYKLQWFSNIYFRQAMSSMLPRERIVREVYRGLAEPANYFFAKANMFFDEDISLQYRFNPDNAQQLLEKAGFSKNSEKHFIDADGNLLEFSIFMGIESTLAQDLANIYADELAKIGVTLNVKPIDFQNLVERLTKNYNWDSVIVSLGVNYFPSSGSNVWQSKGNFHLWYPLQEKPATEWEAQIDELYQKGLVTIEFNERKKIYDKFQKLILEQLPLFYIVYPNSFTAYDTRIQNLFLDNLEGSQFEYLYFK